MLSKFDSQQGRCAALVLRLGLGLFGLIGLTGCDSSPPKPRPISVPVSDVVTTISSPEDEALLKKLCTQCHLFAAPDTLPKSEWSEAIARMAKMPNYGKTVPKRISVQALSQWFEERAPDRLALATRDQTERSIGSVTALSIPPTKGVPFISQVRLVTSSVAGSRRLLACDMHQGLLLEADWTADPPQLKVLSDQVPHPARAEIVDLDGDGTTEFLVANLGSFSVLDHNLGSVDWLRPKNSGWERIILAENLGRVADVKVFDADADGDLDIAVAEFGFRLTGRTLLLENTTLKSQSHKTPQFTQRVLDERHGCEQLEIIDINGDGRQDVVALLAQEHEVLLAFLNQGQGVFQTRELFRAPHPVWGYSGFQLLDMDGDSDIDALITNGDMMDGPSFKPYHAVTWLENTGDLTFVSHRVGEVPGCHRAEAVDFDGDGDLDILACALAPSGSENQAEVQKIEMPPALVWFEQTTPGEYECRVIERGPGRYPCMTVGDVDGNGKPDVVLGVGLWEWPGAKPKTVEAVRLWRR